MENPEKDKLMQALLPTDQQKYKPMDNCAKEQIMRQGNMEFFEIVKQTPKIQCTHCLQYTCAGHVYCPCGTELNFATANPADLPTRGQIEAAPLRVIDGS